MTDDRLFDPTPFESNAKHRAPRQRAQERAVKLVPPWRLLRYHKRAPMAHILLDPGSIPASERPVTRMHGAELGIPQCDPKHSFALIDYGAETPLAPACPKCLKYAEMNRIASTIVERPVPD